MTEQPTSLSRVERRAAKACLVEAMEAGRTWQEAVALCGLSVSRTTAYRWWCEVRQDGENALEDGRHGHASKLRTPVRTWFITYCETHPHATSRMVQQALADEFGVRPCIGYLNQVRAKLGLSYQSPSEKKR